MRDTLKKICIDIQCIWGALQGFPQLRKTISPRVKNYDNFSRVFEITNHLLTCHSLYLAP